MKRRERKHARFALLTLALACVLAVSAGAAGLSVGMQAAAESAAAEPAAVMAAEPVSDPSPAIYVAQRNANSVVGVLTNTQTWNRSTGEVEDTLVSQGSGVVIAQGGYIVTNFHVIESGSAFQVLMPSGEKVDAFFVGADDTMDLAVLKVEETAAAQLIPVTPGSMDSLQVGSTVIAIGNPGGEVLANTVTQGIVSALERTSVNSSSSVRRVSYIQHDAAISSGNSGGGLFNYKGELVGINTLKYAGSAYSSGSYEGLGFAIPIDSVMDVAMDLIEFGKVIRPGFGVTVSTQEGPDEPMPNYAPASVVVHTINENSAAEKAGMQVYDFIYAVDGERVTSLQDLTSILDLHEAGDTVTVTVVRYAQVGTGQNNTNISGMFGRGYGYGYGYGYNPPNNSGYDGQLYVGSGYQFIDLQVTLEELA